MNAKEWINFVRLYGPIPTKDNLYDENLRRHARRRGIKQVLFTHPYEKIVLPHFDLSAAPPASVILTGTAGDGKTFLCGRVWEMLGGDPDAWAGQKTHFQLELTAPAVAAQDTSRKVTLHIVRDLSAWVPIQGADWPADKRELLLRFSRSIFQPNPTEIFLIAANDGQLAETFRRLLPDEDVQRAKDTIEDLLVSDQSERPRIGLKLFNLSRGSSSELLELALGAFLGHEGWNTCYNEASASDQLFGQECPVRRNYELLKQEIVQSRLRDLLDLCDQNGLHVPVRQILILLSNSVLGHPHVKDHLMSASDVPDVVAHSRSQASLYNNVFGGNLPESRRANSLIFDYLERFQIGRETSNRFNNLLIFGDSHEHLQEQFRTFIGSDRFYGADSAFLAAKQDYIEGNDESPEAARRFLELLTSQRRALFFKIPNEQTDDLNFWELTVFKYGGEYIEHVLSALRSGRAIRRNLLARLVRGLNRIFTGMLINSEHELFVASSASLSQVRVCRFLAERISVVPRLGEFIAVNLSLKKRPSLDVILSNELRCSFELTLTRYEYLSRVAEGAMPNSFSKECFEDVMAFKSRVMRDLGKRSGPPSESGEIVFRVLDLDNAGSAREERIGVLV